MQQRRLYYSAEWPWNGSDWKVFRHCGHETRIKPLGLPDDERNPDVMPVIGRDVPIRFFRDIRHGSVFITFTEGVSRLTHC
jgi:hypothetical protein